MREFADEYLRRCNPHWKPSGRKTVRNYVKSRILPTFGKMPLDRIGPEDVAAWFDAASKDRPGAANRAFEILRSMMFLAEEWGLRERGTNPCLGIKKNPRNCIARFLDGTSWRDIGGDAINLPDSMTGPRAVPLGEAARAGTGATGRRRATPTLPTRTLSKRRRRSEPSLRMRWQMLAAIHPSKRRSDVPVQPRNSDCQCLSLGSTDLHRRTGHGRVGTIHAAVAGLGLQHSPAVTAIVEPLTGVGRHRLRFGVTARRTSDGCLQYYRCFLRCHIAYPVIARKTNSAGSRIGSRYPA